jgi:transcriptional regulator with XRE-family HTH domain
MDSTTAGKTALGRFLVARRAQVQPSDIGLQLYDDRRRVAGLRREELAQLAGVSEAYYKRLEQGVSTGASTEVLDAIAGALGLDETERAHLHDLATAARSGRRRARRPTVEELSPATLELVAAFGDTPVVVLGRRSDVLHWNRTGHALFAGHLDASSTADPERRPNTARLVFRDPHTRGLYGEDWPRKARDAVGRLRLAAGRHPDDPLLAELIGELAVHSPEFAELWAEHKVRAWDTARYRMHHPTVGTLDVTQQAMTVPGARGQRLVAVTAAPGSRDQSALILLAQALGAPEAHIPTRTP